ncbi:MAG: hypothetical protein LBT45_03435 [Rickettsiales bacterium]|jgi:hypothetical protein|nr:hypothetical protein [Rickettsiales bacterium]
MKAAIIKIIIQIVLWLILLCVGTWYLYSSIGGISIPYASMPRFLQSIGACDANGVCDIASANGCFLCPYVQKLFLVIGKATAVLWDAIIGHTWIILVIGLAVFMFWQAYEVIKESNKENAALENTGEKKLNFAKWWDAVRKQIFRVMVVCALLGAVGFGGGRALQWTGNAIIYPVMSIGTSLSIAATETGAGGAACPVQENEEQNPMIGVSDSFMCVIGNLNAAVLYGANTGFAMMNFAWMGLGGGFFTWLGGLAIVLLFLYIGFNVVFKVLNVVFNLVFLIIFMPLLLAAAAFDETWKLASGVLNGAIGILAKAAVGVIGITLNVMIVSALVNHGMQSTMSSDTAAEYAIIEKCEKSSANEKGEIEAAAFKACFEAERRANPSAFGYLDKGWDFLVMMLFIFAVYYLLINKELEKRMGISEKDMYFEFGSNLKTFGQTLWKLPSKIINKIPVGKK